MGAISSTATATIANGASLSAAIFLGEGVLVGIQMPAAWTAADLTFQVSVDGGTTWVDLHDDGGAEIKITSPSAGEFRAMDPSNFSSAMFLKVRSGISAAAVAQGAARSLTLMTRKFFPRS